MGCLHLTQSGEMYRTYQLLPSHMDYFPTDRNYSTTCAFIALHSAC